jgi:hypothetical protein
MRPLELAFDSRWNLRPLMGSRAIRFQIAKAPAAPRWRQSPIPTRHRRCCAQRLLDLMQSAAWGNLKCCDLLMDGGCLIWPRH